MKIGFLKTTLYILPFALFFLLGAEDKNNGPIKKDQNYSNIKDQLDPDIYIQDRRYPDIDNPLKGLTSFLFFLRCPAQNKKMSDNIFAIVEKKLSSYGRLNKKRMLVQTDQGEAIDLSVFKTGATLIYQISNLTDLSGNETGFVRASLNLYTATEIVKTKEMCTPYVWSSNCFLKGSTKKNLENLVSLSLDNL
ncbi:MAG: hypothetical protein EB051_04970, partial [Chlamydiia bacterium]|nr:hypothetical protein [Chlamydiia bacterium]